MRNPTTCRSIVGVLVLPRRRICAGNKNGRDVPFWYTMRLEHIHTLPEPWTVQDDFQRVLRWFSLGLDDVLEVSPPWSAHPDVTFRDWQEPPTPSEPYWWPGREYQTPAGVLLHKVRRTDMS